MKDKYLAFLAWLDDFKTSPTKTHLSAFACGIVVGVMLAYR